ncbi:hypothetical protein [Streptococcus orisratti]|uniref:hypothetical protein n=1 Tax=Streptococcus orisratti TaxID=114652 RepID=UPI0023F83ECC|nr:hypothetical protein [Streptococcus orisratti]
MITIVEVRVIKKWRFSSEGEPLSYFYGIELVNRETGDSFKPTYPFSDNLVSLQEFIELYRKDLLDFYSKGWNYSFATYIEKPEDDSHDRFRDSWFKRGVVIY